MINKNQKTKYLVIGYGKYGRIIESRTIKTNILKFHAMSIEKRITKPIPNITAEEIDTILFVLF